mmetsp:Transcript_76534/g.159222  ORF Transcript_76534/g.159222 Transcript_76534/m.159222 type:complete len:200 (+) Transcript_76534:1359-1958(+)
MQLADVCGNQGRTASSIDGHAGALQVEAEAESIRGDTIRSSCGARRPREVDHADGRHAEPIILVDAHQVSNVFWLPLQGLLVVAAFEQRHVRDLHDLALHRIHAFSFSRRDFEESTIEEVHALDAKAAVLGVCTTAQAIRVVVHRVVPTGSWHLGKSVGCTFAYTAPQSRSPIPIRAVAAIHASDRQLFSFRRRWPGAL